MCVNGSREPGRASLTASPSRTNKSFASRDRNGFPLDARADADFPRQGRNRRVFTREREKRKTPNVTRRASPEKKKKTRPAGWYRPRFGFDTSRLISHAGFWGFGPASSARRPFHPHRTSTMSASLCMSMASLAVSGAGRGVTAARMGRAAASKGAVAGSSAFFPAKASAKMTMKSSLAGACAPIPRTNAKPGTRGDATARATATREATAFRERAEPPRARFRASTARRTPARGPRVSGKSVASGTGFFPSVRLSRRESYPSSFIRAS